MSITEYIQKSIDVKQLMLKDKSISDAIEKVSNEIIKAFKQNNKVLIAGNGGSASDAEHFATELVSKMQVNAVALSANSSLITALGNDFDFNQIYVNQIKAMAKKDDIFVGISTSGNSENILLALKEAKKKGLITIGLTGKNSFKTEEFCDYVIKVASNTTTLIQEAHIMIIHIICELAEKNLK